MRNLGPGAAAVGLLVLLFGGDVLSVFRGSADQVRMQALVQQTIFVKLPYTDLSHLPDTQADSCS